MLAVGARRHLGYLSCIARGGYWLWLRHWLCWGWWWARRGRERFGGVPARERGTRGSCDSRHALEGVVGRGRGGRRGGRGLSHGGPWNRGYGGADRPCVRGRVWLSGGVVVKEGKRKGRVQTILFRTRWLHRLVGFVTFVTLVTLSLVVPRR